MKKGIFLALGIFLLTVEIVSAGNIINENKYVWGENIGWIDFGLEIGNVVVSDSKITGYAWGENIGWISLNCENTNNCNSVNYGVLNNNGELSGYAWGENIGWINFNGVNIDENGLFNGYAYGENIGYLSFNCSNTNTCGDIDFKLKTDWKKIISEPEPVVTRRSGGGGGSSRRTITPTEDSVAVLTDESVGEVLGKETVSVNSNKQIVIDDKTIQLIEILITLGVIDSDKASLFRSLFTSESKLIPTENLFNRDLSVGFTGSDVKKLQELLNQNGYTVALSGPGSPREETEYFGELTRQALIKFQQDNNITPAVGYFGPKTRALLTNY